MLVLDFLGNQPLLRHEALAGLVASLGDTLFVGFNLDEIRSAARIADSFFLNSDALLGDEDLTKMIEQRVFDGARLLVEGHADVDRRTNPFLARFGLRYSGNHIRLRDGAAVDTHTITVFHGPQRFRDDRFFARVESVTLHTPREIVCSPPATPILFPDDRPWVIDSSTGRVLTDRRASEAGVMGITELGRGGSVVALTGRILADPARLVSGELEPRSAGNEQLVENTLRFILRR